VTAATLDLSSGADVTQSAGTVTAGTLQSGTNIGGALLLGQGGNAIGTIGAVKVGGDATIADSIALTVVGPFSAANLNITDSALGAVAINVTGSLASAAGKSLTLVTPIGGITVDDGGKVNASTGLMTLTTATGIKATGTLTAGKLTVSATKSGDISLKSVAKANAIGTLSSANLADGTFTITNDQALTIAGPVTANLIKITAAGSLKVSDGVKIVTNGEDRAQQGMAFKLNDDAVAKVDTTKLGSFLAVTSVGGAKATIDTGSFTVTPFSVSKATINLVLPDKQAGTITIGKLDGKTTDLILITRAGGIATGTVDVSGLLVLGSGGKIDLFGTVGGLGGQAAANKANIAPLPSADYRFNACPITSINCVLLPVQTVPLSPLRDVPIIRDRPTQDDADVQLPNVSDEDY